jgi:hexosaminidase
LKLNSHAFVLLLYIRFDHFATLCELLPNSLPSLLLNLLLISRGSSLEEVASAFHEILSCPDLVLPPMSLKEIEGNPRLWQLRKCGFPGSIVLHFLRKSDT